MRVREVTAQVRQLVVQMDQLVPMEKERRDRFTEFLLKRIRVPKNNPDARLQGMSSYLALYQMTLLPEEELKSHFPEEDWNQLEPLLTQVKANAKQMVAQFKLMGIDLDLEEAIE